MMRQRKNNIANICSQKIDEFCEVDSATDVIRRTIKKLQRKKKQYILMKLLFRKRGAR